MEDKDGKEAGAAGTVENGDTAGIKDRIERWVSKDIGACRDALLKIINREETETVITNTKDGIVQTECKSTFAQIIAACKAYNDLFANKVVSQKKWEKEDKEKLKYAENLRKIAEEKEREKARKDGKLAELSKGAKGG